MTAQLAAESWTVEQLPDLTGTTIIVTGGNSGIGLEAVRSFALNGAHVVLAVRDERRGSDAAATVEGSTEVRHLDLADLASVREFAENWRGDIRVLVNNAGVLVPPFGRTRDGFELQFGTNHLGHFALTNLLLPYLTGRVVTVASNAHRTGHIDFDDLDWSTRAYQAGSDAYAQSKLANLLFTLELQRRLEASDSRVIATAAHPGMAATNLGAGTGNAMLRLVGKIAVRWVAQSAAAGAGPTLFAATAPMPGAGYAGPSRRGGMTGPPVLVDRSAAAEDQGTAARLWSVSDELKGVEFPWPC